MQLLVFIQTKQQADLEKGGQPISSLDVLLGSEAGQLTDFIKSTVTIHSVLTDRIDQLRPSQQLTLKVVPTKKKPAFSRKPAPNRDFRKDKLAISVITKYHLS